MGCTKKIFSDALVKTAMIDEMARADHWQSLDECLEFKPNRVKNLARYADAALRAVKKLEEREKCLAHTAQVAL